MATKRPASQPLSGQPQLKRRETGNNSPAPTPTAVSASAVSNAPADPKACLNALLSNTAALATAEVELSVLQSQHTQASEDTNDAKKRRNFSSYLEIKQRFAAQKLAEVRQCQDKVDTLQAKKSMLSESFIVSVKSPTLNEDSLISRITQQLDAEINAKIRHATAGFEKQISQQKGDIAQLQDEIKTLNLSSAATKHNLSCAKNEVNQLRDSLTSLLREHEFRHETVIKVGEETKSNLRGLAEDIVTLAKESTSYQRALESVNSIMETMPDRIMKVEANMRMVLADVDHLKELPLVGNPQQTHGKRLDELEKHAQSWDKQVDEMRDQIENSYSALDLLTGDENEPGVLRRLYGAEAHLRTFIDSIDTLKPKVAALDSLQADCEQEFERLTTDNAALSLRVDGLNERNDASIIDGKVKPLESSINSIGLRLQEYSKRVDAYSSDVAHVRASSTGNAQIALFHERIQKMESTLTSLKKDVGALPSQTQTSQTSTDVVKKEEFEALQVEAKTIKRETDQYVATFSAVQQAVQHLEARVNNTTTEHISSMLDRWLWEHGQKGLRNVFAPIKVVGEIETLTSENDNRVKEGKALRTHVDNIDQNAKASFEHVSRELKQLSQFQSSTTEVPQKIAQLFLAMDNLKLRTTNLAHIEIETKRLGQLFKASASDEAINHIKEQISSLRDKLDNGLNECRNSIKQVSTASTHAHQEMNTTKLDLEKRREADVAVMTDHFKQIDKEYKMLQEKVQKFPEDLKEALDKVEEVVKKYNEISSLKDDFDVRADGFDEQLNNMVEAQFKNISKENFDKLQKRVDEITTWRSQHLEPEKIRKVISDVEELHNWIEQAKIKRDQEAATTVPIRTGPRVSTNAFSIKGAAIRDQASRETPATMSATNQSTSIPRTQFGGNNDSQGSFLNSPVRRQNTAPQAQSSTSNGRPSTPATTSGQPANATSAKNNSFQPRIKREMTNISSSSDRRNTPGPSTPSSGKVTRRQKRDEKRRAALERRKDVEMFDLTNMASDDEKEKDPLVTTRLREGTEEL